MNALQVYKVIHLSGVLLVFLSLGGLIIRSLAGSDDKGLKLMGVITHGIGMFLSLLGGFGFMARAGFEYGQGWVIVKIVIWVILGGVIAIINRKPEACKALWFVILVLGITAAFMAGVKPF